MGYYINPPTMSKEGWLQQHARRQANGDIVSRTAPEKFREEIDVAVCLVDNGWMTAAGICVDQRELETFTNPSDNRPKFWFMVPIADIYALHPEFEGSISDVQ